MHVILRAEIEKCAAIPVAGHCTADSLVRNALCFQLHHIHTCLIRPVLVFFGNFSDVSNRF